ncbi:MAG TPA: MmgE/PrpD family protein [Candidatus Acidoferrales bacterium]|nr:MmgE/PrpD family protein [Candidatus Acidoferrales bacterium]
MGVTREIVGFVHESRFEGLSPEVVQRAKDLIADAIGVMLAGAREDGSRILRRHAKQSGAKSRATVVAGGFKTSPANAALVNAAAGHALDYDSIQLSSWPGTAHGIRIHPTVPALAAALAVGEPLAVPGKLVILATVLGIEVACRVTEAIPPDAYPVAYQSTATMGGLGAAAAAGKLLRLKPDALMRAFGLAATMAGGLRENFGTMTKPFHSGRAAESGVIAAELARAGFTAAPDVLEARRGFFLAMGGKHDEAQILGRLGRPHFLIDPGLHIKRYPCAILIHPAIKEMIALRSKGDLDSDQIEKITVHVSEIVTSTLNHPRPSTGLEAKFSVAFPLALALAEGKVGLRDFTDEKVREPKIKSLMERTEVVADPAIAAAGGNEVSARITVELSGGQRLKRAAGLEKGTAQEWISEAELRAKFEDAASRALPQREIERIWGLLAKLDRLPSIAPMMKIARAGRVG